MGHPEIESTDRIEGIAPAPKRVRLDPGRPGKIIAVPKLPKSNSLSRKTSDRSRRSVRHVVVPRSGGNLHRTQAERPCWNALARGSGVAPSAVGTSAAPGGPNRAGDVRQRPGHWDSRLPPTDQTKRSNVEFCGALHASGHWPCSLRQPQVAGRARYHLVERIYHERCPHGVLLGHKYRVCSPQAVRPEDCVDASRSGQAVLASGSDHSGIRRRRRWCEAWQR